MDVIKLLVPEGCDVRDLVPSLELNKSGGLRSVVAVLLLSPRRSTSVARRIVAGGVGAVGWVMAWRGTQERATTNRTLAVTCNGDPRAKIGDKMPVIGNSEQDAVPLP
jgi:hypothetical protein